MAEASSVARLVSIRSRPGLGSVGSRPSPSLPDLLSSPEPQDPRQVPAAAICFPCNEKSRSLPILLLTSPETTASPCLPSLYLDGNQSPEGARRRPVHCFPEFFTARPSSSRGVPRSSSPRLAASSPRQQQQFASPGTAPPLRARRYSSSPSASPCTERQDAPSRVDPSSASC